MTKWESYDSSASYKKNYSCDGEECVYGYGRSRRVLYSINETVSAKFCKNTTYAAEEPSFPNEFYFLVLKTKSIGQILN